MRYNNNEMIISIELLESGRETIVRAVGMSMFPWILPKEKLIISPIKDRDLKIGDIVIFLSNNRLIAHRLVKIDNIKNIYFTRGDGNLKTDTPISYEDIKGVVTKIRDNRMFWTKWANGKLSFLIAKTSVIFSPINWLLGKVSAKIISQKR